MHEPGTGHRLLCRSISMLFVVLCVFVMTPRALGQTETPGNLKRVLAVVYLAEHAPDIPAADAARFAGVLNGPSFWQQYKWRIVGAFAVCVAEAILIIVLLLERRRRRLAHLALQQSEENLERSQAVSLVMTTHISLDLKWLRVPSTLCMLLGYSEAELLEWRLEDITYAEDFERSRLKYDQLVNRESKSFTSEQRVTAKDGRTVWIFLTATLVSDQNQKPLYFLAYLKDITRSKLSEERLRQSEERFVKAFAANPQPMALTSLDDDEFIDVNESFLLMSGYRREEVLGQTPAALRFWGEPTAQISERRRAHLRNEELRFRTKSGEYRVLLASAELLELGWKQCLLIAATDITDRKKLEEDLKRSERDFSTLVENSPDVICRLDRNLRYTYVSPSLKRLGLDDELFIGKTVAEIDLPGFDLKGFELSCWHCISSRQTVTRDFTYESRSYWTRIIPELGSDGSVESVITISEDVTDRLRTERELAQLTHRLLNIQDDERRRIARDLHDGTAQNLFAITVNLASLEKRFDAGGHEQQLVNECQTLVDESLKEIRTLSYLLHPPLLDHAGLVSALRWYVEGFTKRSSIHVSVIAQPIGRLASEVETALFRIVQESLTNVRRHSEGNSVVIRLERRPRHVVLEIRDNGRGFKADWAGQQTESYEPGVGIPGMKQRLHQLGGNLEITSNGNGTLIAATVPLANGHQKAALSSGGR